MNGGPTIAPQTPVSGGGGGTKTEYVKIAGTNGSVGSFGGHSITSNGGGQLSGYMPNDYGSGAVIRLINIPGGTNAAADIDLISQYGAVGESSTTHTTTDTTSTYAFVNGVINAMDATSLFPSVAAGDYLGLDVDHNAIGFSALYLFWEITYTPA